MTAAELSARAQEDRDHAVRLLCHYLKTVFEKSGLKWDSDNDTEVEAIVDLILNSAGERMAALFAKAREARES